MNDEVKPDSQTPHKEPEMTAPEPVETDARVSETAPPAAAAERGGKNTVVLIIALLALLLAALVAVADYFIWQEVQRSGQWQQQVLNKLDDRARALDARIDSVADRFKDGLQATQDAQSQAERARHELAAQLGGMDDSMAFLRDQMGRSQDDWVLAEVQYLLYVANQRLQLQRDLGTGLAALESADLRLQEMGDPGFTEVRQQIAREMAAVRAVREPDIAGVALALDSLIRRVPELPLGGAQYVPPPPGAQSGIEDSPILNTDDWKQLPSIIWGELKGLVVVRRNDQPIGPMLAPEQQYFLSENLRLQLDAARIAALREEPGNFTQSLANAAEWMQAYYALDDSAVQSALREIERLRGVELRPAMPDVSTSLRMMRQRIRLMDQARPAVEPVEVARPAPEPAAALVDDTAAVQSDAETDSAEPIPEETPAVTTDAPADAAENEAVEPAQATADEGADAGISQTAEQAVDAAADAPAPVEGASGVPEMVGDAVDNAVESLDSAVPDVATEIETTIESATDAASSATDTEWAGEEAAQ